MGKKSNTSNESFAKRPSEVELEYNPKTALEGTVFTDPRGRSYRIDSGGQLRALNKPQSRAKRLREAKREQKAKEKPART